MPYWRVPQVLLTHGGPVVTPVGLRPHKPIQGRALSVVPQRPPRAMGRRGRRAAATGSTFGTERRIAAFVAVGSPQCIALASDCDLLVGQIFAVDQVACITTCISASLVTLIIPPAAGDGAGGPGPVVFAEPYIRWQRGLAFTVITAVCVLTMATLARFRRSRRRSNTDLAGSRLSSSLWVCRSTLFTSW